MKRLPIIELVRKSTSSGSCYLPYDLRLRVSFLTPNTEKWKTHCSRISLAPGGRSTLSAHIVPFSEISLSRTHGLCMGAHSTCESETTVRKFSSMTAENIRPGQVLLWVTFPSHFSSIFLPYPFLSPHLYSSTFLLSPPNASSFQTKMLWGQRISPSWRLSVPRASCWPPQSKAWGTSRHHDTHERQVGLWKAGPPLHT